MPVADVEDPKCRGAPASSAGGPRRGTFRPIGGFPDLRQGAFPLLISPSVQYLLIVAAKQPELWRYLTHNFAGDPKVEVILDRRWGERRQGIEKHEPERRRARRRQPSPQPLDRGRRQLPSPELG